MVLSVSISKEERQSFAGKRMAVIGAGKIGTILLQALLRENLISREHVIATVAHPERAAALAKELKVSVTANNLEAVQQADIVLVCVKPVQVAPVLEEVRPGERQRQAGGTSQHSQQRALGQQLPHEPAAARAERRAEGQLARAHA